MTSWLLFFFLEWNNTSSRSLSERIPSDIIISRIHGQLVLLSKEIGTQSEMAEKKKTKKGYCSDGHRTRWIIEGDNNDDDTTDDEDVGGGGVREEVPLVVASLVCVNPLFLGGEGEFKVVGRAWCCTKYKIVYIFLSFYRGVLLSQVKEEFL